MAQAKQGAAVQGFAALQLYYIILLILPCIRTHFSCIAASLASCSFWLKLAWKNTLRSAPASNAGEYMFSTALAGYLAG